MAPRAPFLWVKQNTTNPFALFIGSIFFILIAFSFLYYFKDKLDEGFAVPASSMIVVAGFLFNSAVKLHSEARERAFKYLETAENDDELLKTISFLGKTFHALDDNVLPKQDAIDIYINKEKYPPYDKLIEKILSFMNFFEVMAISIRLKEIDEEILYQFYGGMYSRVFRYTLPFLPIIRNVPRVKDHPQNKTKRPETFENAEWLFVRWHRRYKEHSNLLSGKQYNNTNRYYDRP